MKLLPPVKYSSHNSKLLLSLLPLLILLATKVVDSSSFTLFHPSNSHISTTSSRKAKVSTKVVVVTNMVKKGTSSRGSNNSSKEIYNIRGSGWKSPSWNWGYASGTGHDCALICRNKFNTRDGKVRQDLIQSLLHPTTGTDIDTDIDIDIDTHNIDPPFEELKLILGLTIQRGRWDGTDGGAGGYGEVLTHMAQAKRYESNDDKLNSQLFVQDMSNRFHLIAGNQFVGDDADDDNNNKSTDGNDKADNSLEMMKQIQIDCSNDYDMMRRRCTGLVLQKMGFIELGM